MLISLGLFLFLSKGTKDEEGSSSEFNVQHNEIKSVNNKDKVEKSDVAKQVEVSQKEKQNNLGQLNKEEEPIDLQNKDKEIQSTSAAKHNKKIFDEHLARVKKLNSEAHDDIHEYNDFLINGYGKTPEIGQRDTKPVQSVIEALNTGKYPERVSIAIKPKAFDEKRFVNDAKFKQKYLDTVEPGRVRQSKNPGRDVPKIKRLSPYYQEVYQGEKVPLKVKALPGMPVTFTSLDLGMFSNGLTSMTVLCDSQGFANVEFHGMEGTAADTNILVSCPVTSGQLKFIVFTKKKKVSKI